MPRAVGYNPGVPNVLRSFRTKLQLAFVVLGLAATGVTGWQASAGAAAALTQASYDRLTAVRETRASELERYFVNIHNQVAALAGDEATLEALEQFEAAWNRLPSQARSEAAIEQYYRSAGMPLDWVPRDARTRALQLEFIVRNPHPYGAKDILLEAPQLGAYSRVHARFHPSFHRYRSAFGFYDVFLISPNGGRVLYTVLKEIDLGVSLEADPYRHSPLAAIYHKVLERARQAGPLDPAVVMEDYRPYVPSGMAPAAFVAAAVRRAGKVEGVFVIQVAIDEVNSVMDGGARWREQGLGETGQVYIVGPDNTLRSDLRRAIERPEDYFQELRAAGIGEDTVEAIRRHGTAVLAYPVDLDVVARVQSGERGTELGRNVTGRPVLRSHAPLQIGDLRWAIIAEIESEEALIPVVALRRRILTTALAVAVVLFAVAGWLGDSVARRVLAAAAVARRLGRGERGLRVPVRGRDEIAQLAADFNRMSDDLERTTVSRNEFQALAHRLLTAQEDERKRIARELHDDFTQRLAAAAIEAGVAERNAAGAPESVRASLVKLKQQLALISEEVHGLSRRLHPAMLDDLGLPAAIEAECRALLERGGPLVTVHIEGDFSSMAKDAQLALYRIVQEALRNIHKHSGASEAELTLSQSAAGVELTIRDYGQGFDRHQPGWRPGLGLASMEERARLLGGRFHVESHVGHGTVIRVWLPEVQESAT
jgi:signal transduction histidine kinase